MDVDRAFITRLAYGLDQPVFAQPHEQIEGLRLVELRELLINARGEDIPVRAAGTPGSARVAASRLRAVLGSKFIVTTDEAGMVFARVRAAGEPARTKHLLRFDKARWMTADEAATSLGMSKLWLRQLSNRGEVTRKHFGRRVLYRRPDVERLRARRAAEKQSTS